MKQTIQRISSNISSLFFNFFYFLFLDGKEKVVQVEFSHVFVVMLFKKWMNFGKLLPTIRKQVSKSSCRPGTILENNNDAIVLVFE